MFTEYRPSQIARRLVNPITRERFISLVECWSKIVKYRECASIYYYSKEDLLRRFAQLANDKVTLKKYFGTQNIALIDIDRFELEDSLDWQKTLNTQDIFIIVGMERPLMVKHLDYFAFFDNVVCKHPDKSFLFFFQANFTSPEFFEVFTNKNCFYQNVIRHTLHGLKDVDVFISYLEKKWSVSVTKDVREMIKYEAGPHLWLVKQCVRYVRDHRSCPTSAIFNHEQMRYRLEAIWKSFVRQEQSVLEKITMDSVKLSHDEQHALDFLCETGWVIRRADKFELSIPLLGKYIHSIVEHNTLTVNSNGHVCLETSPLIQIFSPQEENVIRLLLHNKNKLVSRDQVAQAIWGDDWIDKYSGWALDQIISRVRKKIKKLRVSNKLITKRRKGIIMT